VIALVAVLAAPRRERAVLLGRVLLTAIADGNVTGLDPQAVTLASSTCLPRWQSMPSPVTRNWTRSWPVPAAWPLGSSPERVADARSVDVKWQVNDCPAAV
jgi:hypothetical protein